MAEQETYEGWTNRETWAFWLWVTNDQGWYESVREYADDKLRPTYRPTDYELGELVVDYVRETLNEMRETLNGGTGYETPSEVGRRLKAYEQINMMRDEIGSWWRIDYAEIGAAARELASDS